MLHCAGVRSTDDLLALEDIDLEEEVSREHLKSAVPAGRSKPNSLNVQEMKLMPLMSRKKLRKFVSTPMLVPDQCRRTSPHALLNSNSTINKALLSSLLLVSIHLKVIAMTVLKEFICCVSFLHSSISNANRKGNDLLRPRDPNRMLPRPTALLYRVSIFPFCWFLPLMREECMFADA